MHTFNFGLFCSVFFLFDLKFISYEPNLFSCKKKKKKKQQRDKKKTLDQKKNIFDCWGYGLSETHCNEWGLCNARTRSAQKQLIFIFIVPICFYAFANGRPI